MTNCRDKCWCKKLPIRESEIDDPPLLQGITNMAHKIEHLYDGIEKCFERIEKIDDFLIIKDQVNQSIQNRLETLEGYMHMEDRITACDVLMRLAKLEETKKAPHKCPICNGEGYIKGIDSNKIAWGHRCQTCEGKGIVWE